MTMTDAFLKEAFAADTPMALLTLLTFTFSGGTTRYTDNAESVVSNGETYTPRPFRFALPPSLDERLPDVRITIDDTDLALTALLRAHEGDPPTVNLAVVSTLNLDDAVRGPIALTVKSSASGKPGELEILAGVEDLLNRSAVPLRYSPGITPGVLSG